MHFQSLLSSNNNNATNIQQKLKIDDLLPQNQQTNELKTINNHIINQDSNNFQQQNALYTALLDATTKSNNLNKKDIFKDVHFLRHRLKRQTLSTQSQNSTLGNET